MRPLRPRPPGVRAGARAPDVARARRAWCRRLLVVAAAERHRRPGAIDLAGLRRLDNRTAAAIAAVRRAGALDGVATSVVGASGAVAADAGKLGLGELLDAGR